MIFSLPANAGADLASSTASVIGSLAPVATLIVGAVFAFFIIDNIIIMLMRNEK